MSCAPRLASNTACASDELEHNVRSEVGAVDLQHVLLQHKVLPPEREQIGLGKSAGTRAPRSAHLNGAAGRAVVVETLDTAVDAEGSGVEEAMLEQLLETRAARRLAASSARASAALRRVPVDRQLAGLLLLLRLHGGRRQACSKSDLCSLRQPRL